mgnify:CR=1 FL=1
MDFFSILETFGLPILGCICLSYFIWRQQHWIQEDLRKDLEKQSVRIESIIIGLINSIKKMQVDTGKEIARLEGSYRALQQIIQKLQNNGKSDKDK